ncbi:hydroxymethylbilane synthase [Microbacterium sp. gxy059]|uniref:hydroxymethylbilane synthase n=1 Tax=Microbacterium sp. gxy059 TaxID=2957199 RepID=UPI003D99C910
MTSPSSIRLGTRRSRLATAQAGMVARDLERVSGRPVELVEIVSEGDTSRASLASLGGTGVFATRLREALLVGECDLLVHSLKDLPVAQPPGLVIAATPVRADARDVVITRDGAPLGEMPAGARIGTGSPRRIAQVRRANPGVRTHDLRGNIDSRMGRVRSGELDAVVLAAAGLGRVDASDEGASTLGDLRAEPRDLGSWPTAAGQAALAVETRADADPELAAWIARLDDPLTRFAVDIERAVLGGIEAGCHAPVGAHARVEDDELRAQAVVYGDGETTIVAERRERIPDLRDLVEGYIVRRGSGAAVDGTGLAARASEIGLDLARRLLDDGAADIVRREAPTT